MNSNKTLLLCFVFLALLGLSSSSIAQVRIDLKPEDRAKPEAKAEDRYRVPEANISCSVDEATWWKSLRDAGDEVRRSRGDKSSSKKFVGLISEGATKSYLPPVQDRKAVILSKTEPGYTKEARQRGITGGIAMRVELLPDGTVGEVKLMNSLGAGLDESAVSAARKTVFLPAVKDRKFARFEILMEMHFNLY